MFIDYQTLIIIILIAFMVILIAFMTGFIMGVRFVRPRYDRYER